MLDHKEWIYKIGQFQELVRYAYMDAVNSYEVIENHDKAQRYQLSLGFLNLSFASYLELKRIYNDYEDIQHYEYEPFFKAYDHYIFQLKKVITDKDENTSWLYSAYEDLKEKWIYVNDFMSNTVKNT